MITAEIIADSLNPIGDRLTTFIVQFPRIVLAEFNTHRALSKNSASSRAIPFEKMLEMTKNNPFIPIKFQKDHKGMQGTEYYEGMEHRQCVEDWLAARDLAIIGATNFHFPVTKQIRNRILEPYMWHKVIVTGSEWENFFALRAHQDAEIHIADLAEKMLQTYNASMPVRLKAGEWHIPFGDKIDEARLDREFQNYKIDWTKISWSDNEERISAFKRKIAIARCARISYLNFEGKDDYEADIKLCDRLFGSVPRHLSPTEHVAQAMPVDYVSGNFRGFKQYRKFFADECLKDPRVIKK